MSPVRKTDPKIRERIVELLRDDWTPQRIADEGKLADGSELGVSAATVGRIAREAGLAARRGPRQGKRPSGLASGGTTKRRTEVLGAEVVRLRGLGHSWAEIAELLSLHTRQHAKYLHSVAESKKSSIK